MPRISRPSRPLLVLAVLLIACDKESPLSAVENRSPAVTIQSPSDGAQLTEGQAVTLAGSASDPEDGDLGAAIAWSSSLNGALGTGANLRVELSEGDHTITASVTDSRGHTATISVGVSVHVPPVTWLSITTGAHFTCGVVTGGAGYCWGPGAVQRGDGTTTHAALVPVPIAGGHTWKSLDAGASHTCGVATGDALYCWGENLWGQLGTGSTQVEAVPVQVAAGMSWASVTAGPSHTCALTTAGDAYCWGSNSNGQLGNGTTVNRAAAVPVAGGHKWTSLTAGNVVTCGVTTGGAAYCWGFGNVGQLGDGGRRSKSVPTLVSGGLSWSGLSGAFQLYVCGVAATGALYCWGQESAGELGDGGVGIDQALSPSLVAGGHQWVSVAAGRVHTCGITTSGEAYCWGDKVAPLGDSHSTAQVSPAPVSGGMTWKLLSAGWNHTCGIATSGEAWCWGNEAEGRLGNGSTGSYRVGPSRVVDPSG